MGVSNTYTAGGLQLNDSFYATATNSFGCVTDISNKVNVAMPNLPATPAPTCFAETASSITFTWPRVSNADGYWVSTDSGQSWRAVKPGPADTSFTVTGLSFDTYVDLYIEAYNHSQCKFGPVGQALCKTISCSNITYNLTYDSVICAGGLVGIHFSNISASKYSISANGSAPTTDTFLMVAPDANDQIQISLKDSSSSCAPSKILLPVTVHKLISLRLHSDVADSTYCVGSKATLTATSGFSNYTFYKNRVSVQSGTSSAYTTPALSLGDSFNVSGTNTYGCGNASASTGLFIQAPPKPVLGYSINGLVATFNDSTSNDASRIWYFGDGDTGLNATEPHSYTIAAKYKVVLKAFSSAGCYDTVSSMVTAVIKAGIEANSAMREVSIYPNPSHSSFSVSFFAPGAGTGFLRVMNMNGQTVTEKQLSIDEGQNTLLLDLSNSPQGFYFMQFITTDGVDTYKLIKD